MPKISQHVKIQNRKGLHARASAQLVKLAETFKTQTSIRYQDMCVPADSIMDLLMLGAAQGAVITIEGEGEDAEQAINALVHLINDEFGEK